MTLASGKLVNLESDEGECETCLLPKLSCFEAGGPEISFKKSIYMGPVVSVTCGLHLDCSVGQWVNSCDLILTPVSQVNINNAISFGTLQRILCNNVYA